MALLSHRQGWWLAVLLSAFPCVFSASDTNGGPEPTYQTSTSEVRVAFFATDENQRLVDTIVRDDFAVVDNGMVIRKFRSLGRSSETALDVVVLIDASESVKRRVQEVIQVVRRSIAESPLSAADRLSIMTFSGLQPHTLCASDCRSASAERRLLAIKAEGATPLFDALTSAAKDLAARHKPEVRTVLILLSDGNDTISRSSARESLDLVLASGAAVYALNPNHGNDPSGSLTVIAEATGGRVLPWRDGFLQDILAEQRASYVVTYALPSRERGFHLLRILPKHNLNLQFHCRKGYYYDEAR